MTAYMIALLNNCNPGIPDYSHHASLRIAKWTKSQVRNIRCFGWVRHWSATQELKIFLLKSKLQPLSKETFVHSMCWGSPTCRGIFTTPSFYCLFFSCRLSIGAGYQRMHRRKCLQWIAGTELGSWRSDLLPKEDRPSWGVEVTLSMW